MNCEWEAWREQAEWALHWSTSRNLGENLPEFLLGRRLMFDAITPVTDTQVAKRTNANWSRIGVHCGILHSRIVSSTANTPLFWKMP